MNTHLVPGSASSDDTSREEQSDVGDHTEEATFLVTAADIGNQLCGLVEAACAALAVSVHKTIIWVFRKLHSVT